MKLRAVVLTLVVLAAARASAQTPRPAADGAGSGIRITRLTTFRAPVKRAGALQPGVMECVSFVNDGARPAAHVQFMFAYDDPSGKTLGADGLGRYGFKQMECISFKNVAPKPVASFQVRFTFHAVDGSVAEENTQTRSGQFAPGVEIVGALNDRSAVPKFQNCWNYKAPRDDLARVTITIPSVMFANGMTP